jgi:single-stranded-DNA-specific exonuclease
MRVGIACLIEDDPESAMELAKQLHEINAQRKEVEREMTQTAEAVLDALSDSDVGASIVVYDPGFHEGVIGIVAGRIKEQWHRPCFVFAKSHAGTAKGSGRSIPGLHLRDVLDLVSKRHPGLLTKFGGHAMAAGATVSDERVEEFADAFEAECAVMLSQEIKQRVIQHDGSLGKGEYTTSTAEELGVGVWGQGFEPPLFVDKVRVLSQKIVGEKHLKLSLNVNGENRDAIWFGRTEALKESCALAYTVGTNEWNGRKTVQMMVQGEYVV